MQVSKEKLEELAELSFDAGRQSGLQCFKDAINKSLDSSQMISLLMMNKMLSDAISHCQKEESIND